MKHARWLITMIVLAGMLTLVGCGSKTAASGGQTGGGSGEKIVLRVGDFASPMYDHIKIAKLKGFYEEEFAKDNIEVEVINSTNGPATNEAFAAKRLDVAIIGDQPALAGVANGVGSKIIAIAINTEKGNGIVVGANSPITSVSELKGKKIGIGIGTAHHQIALNILSTGGLTEDDIQLVNLTGNEARAAIISGDLDAALVGDPALTTWVHEGDARLLRDGEGFQNSVVIAAREEYLEKHADIVVRFLRVLDRTSKWIDENEEEAFDLLAEETNAKREFLPLYMHNYDRKLHLNEKDIAAITKTYNFVRERNLIRKDLNLDEIIDDTYIKQALGDPS